MKRYILILAAILAVCTVFLTACGEEGVNTPADDEATIVDGAGITENDDYLLKTYNEIENKK